MRPSRDEVLTAARRALTEFVAPEVQSTFARTQLTYALGLLAALSREGRRKYGSRAREPRTAAPFAFRWPRAAGVRGDERSAARRVARVAAEGIVGVGLPALREERARLWEMLIKVQAACEEAPEEQSARVVAGSMLQFLRKRARLTA